MSYEKFITDFLNIKPSDLSKISTSTGSDGSVSIRIRLSKKSVLCPYCNGNVKVKAYYDRKLTHSTFSNRFCYIIYEQRRYICKSCSCSFNESNHLSASREKLTYETKINILKDLKHPEETYTSVANRYNTSPNKVLRIFDKHVNIPRKKLPAVLSIDEHYFPSSDHNAKYCCFLMNFETGEMVDVLPDRKKAYLTQYFSMIKCDTFTFTTNMGELDNVKFISIDMYENFRNIARTFFPKAKVCADSFHVLKHLTDDFRKVRIKCQNSTENPTFKASSS